MTFTLKDLIHTIAKHNFCILATQGSEGPHISGVGYFSHEMEIYIPTSAKTTKARNIRRDSHVAVCIPVPWPLVPAPPRCIQFRGKAEILPIDDPCANAALGQASFIMRKIIRQLINNVDTKTWGESIWLHVHPIKRIETFMIGIPITTISRDLAKAIRHFDIPNEKIPLI